MKINSLVRYVFKFISFALLFYYLYVNFPKLILWQEIFSSFELDRLMYAIPLLAALIGLTIYIIRTKTQETRETEQPDVLNKTQIYLIYLLAIGTIISLIVFVILNVRVLKETIDYLF